MLVDVQLVMLVIATLVLSLHHVLPQNLSDGLHVLDGIVSLVGAGLKISREVVGIAGEFAGGCEGCYVAW